MQIFSLMCCEGTFGQESERARKANLLPHSCCSFLKHSQACCLNFGSLSSSFLVHACWWNCQASFTSNFWCTGRIFFIFYIFIVSWKTLIKFWLNNDFAVYFNCLFGIDLLVHIHWVINDWSDWQSESCSRLFYCYCSSQY